MKKMSKGYFVFNCFNIVFMVLVIIATAYPLLYCLFASFSDPNALTTHKGALFFALQPFTTGAYQKVFRHPLLLSGFGNTLFVLLIGTPLNVFFTVLTAYPLSRKGQMLNKPVNLFILFTMYFSGGMIPEYLNIQSLGLLDSRWSLILPGLISAYNMIIMRSAFASVPDSLEESARLDGASHMTILMKIFLPLSKATVAVLTLYYAVAHWNSWFNASIYLEDRSKYPLQLVMRNILDSANVSEIMGDVSADGMANYVELVKYALIIVATVPILILYPFLQKYFVQGTMIGAVKE